jgi:hypothetical protein
VPLEAPLNGTQAGSLCYITPARRHSRCTVIAPEMALGDRSTVRKSKCSTGFQPVFRSHVERCSPGLRPWAEPFSHLPGINYPECPSPNVQTAVQPLHAWLRSCCSLRDKKHPEARVGLWESLLTFILRGLSSSVASVTSVRCFLRPRAPPLKKIG